MVYFFIIHTYRGVNYKYNMSYWSYTTILVVFDINAYGPISIPNHVFFDHND